MGRKPKPQFKVGELVRICTGRYEGFTTPIRLRIWNKKATQWIKPGWLYKTNYGVHTEGNLVEASSRQGWHYDSQGYCDNPGRGY